MKPKLSIFKSFNLLISIFLILLLSLFSAIGGLQCKKPTPPDIDDTPKPGKRDYTWTIDTLAYPGSMQTLMQDIWASSPTNVYVVGHNDQNKGMMYRYDGQKWAPVKVTWSESGPVQSAIGLSAIYGFGPNDIYAVGRHIYQNPTPPPNFLDSSLIIHFDGVGWKEMQMSAKGRLLAAINGSSSSNIWVGGSNGTAFHYDGIAWSRIDGDSVYGYRGFEVDGLDVYALAGTSIPGGYSVHFFLHHNENGWAVADSFSEGINPAIFGHYDLQMIDGSFYSVGAGIFRKAGTGWVKIQETSTLLSIYGTRKEHIFAVGNLLNVWHFNGNNWVKLVVPGNPIWLLTSVWCDESEVFIVAMDGYETYILHGR